MLCKMADTQSNSVSRIIVIVICQVLLEYHGHDTSVKPYVRGTLGDNEALRVIITYHQVHVY